MKIGLKIVLLVIMLAVLLVAPTGLALASSGGNAPRQGVADENNPDEGNDPTEGSSGQRSSPFCTTEETDFQHPVAANIADTYGATYEEVIGYFCEGYGFGEIMLAYMTAGSTEPPTRVADLLEQKGQGNGWGKIWKAMGLIGNERDGGAAPGHGRGKPDWAGKPDHANGATNNPGHGNNSSQDNNCPGNSCNNPGRGNDKNTNDNENTSSDDQSFNNGSPGSRQHRRR